MTTPDPTTKDGLTTILATARSAARDAALVALKGFRRAPAVEHKGEVDLVTAFDRASEDLLRKRLSEALPFAVVGEERGGASADVAFYVDPIDGTTNFVHGHPFWCVSIGLVILGQPVLGVVVSPALGIEWFAWIAQSGERIARRRSMAHGIVSEPTDIVEDDCKVSSVAKIGDALFATGFPTDRRTSADNNFDAFVTVKRQCRGIRRCGSAALDLSLVADGTYDGYWERKLNAWDIAGGSAILRAAGGRVTDLDGGDRFLATGGIVATNGILHEALSTVLASVPRRGSKDFSAA